MEIKNTVGRRKTAVARVYVKAGNGTITINKQPLEKYFPTVMLQETVKQPLRLLSETNNYDVKAILQGGGFKGQAEALRLGIARALVEFNQECKKELKSEGYLTRDARCVERKKPGQPKARKRHQFSKR